MKSRKGSYLPALEIPAAFIYDLQRLIEQFSRVVKRERLEISSLMPPALIQNCALLALVTDVDNANANLNIVLADLDKLAADPFYFSDTNPFARLKFLLRSVHAEFERLSEFFDQLLHLCAAGHKLTCPERRRLQAIFGKRLRLLLAAAEAEELVTSGRPAHAGGYDTLLRGVAYVQARIEAAEPEHTTVMEWTKRVRPRVQACRRRIFDAGMQVVNVWSGGISLLTSQKNVVSIDCAGRASTRRLAGSSR